MYGIIFPVTGFGSLVYAYDFIGFDRSLFYRKRSHPDQKPLSHWERARVRVQNSWGVNDYILPIMSQALSSIWPLSAKKFDGYWCFATGSA
jgi:hypothetical protein